MSRDSGTATHYFNNYGTLRREVSSGTATIDGGICFVNNGVVDVDTGTLLFSGCYPAIQIQAKPDRLVAFNQSLNDVLAAARHVTALHGAGFVETANQRIIVRATGQPVTPEQIGDVVVSHHDGLSVRLRDVAAVVEGAEPKFGDALIRNL